MRSRRVRSRSTTAATRALDEARRLVHEAAVLEDEAAAVVDQAVLRADGVGVDQHGLVVGGARRQHLAARRVDAQPIGRGRDVDDDLGAREAAPPHRPVGRPRVLADLDADGAEVEREQIVAERHARRRRAPAPARRARRSAPRRRRCRSAASPSARSRARGPRWTTAAALNSCACDRHGQAEHEHGAGVGGLAREGLEAAPLRVEEAAPLHQVLGRIAADRPVQGRRRG